MLMMFAEVVKVAVDEKEEEEEDAAVLVRMLMALNAHLQHRALIYWRACNRCHHLPFRSNAGERVTPIAGARRRTRDANRRRSGLGCGVDTRCIAGSTGKRSRECQGC